MIRILPLLSKIVVLGFVLCAIEGIASGVTILTDSIGNESPVSLEPGASIGTSNETKLAKDNEIKEKETASAGDAFLVGENLILNPEFDQGSANWTFADYTGPAYGNGGNLYSVVTGAGLSGTNSAFVDIITGNVEGWTLQLRQDLTFRLEVGKTYSISVMAKAQTARQISISFSAIGTNIEYWNQQLNLTTSPQTFTYQFTCTNANVNNESAFRFNFLLARTTISDVWVDNVIVQDITNIPVTDVAVSPSSQTLTVGQTGQLATTITPSNATDPSVTWSSSSPGVATVNSSTGLVTAVAPGTATITATSVSTPAESGTSSVTVNAASGLTPLIGLKFDETSGVPLNSGSLSATFVRSSTTPAISTNVPTGGGARSLDFGTTNGNYYVETTSVIDGLKSLTSFTITGWLNIRNTATGSGGNRIVSWINGGGDGVDLVYHGDGKLQIGIDQWPDGSPATSNTGKVTIDAAASAANWVFFGVTYQSTTNEVKYYFGNNATDATLDVTRTYNRGAVGTNTAKLAIGHFNDATRAAALDRMLKGLVDEIQIHGSALTLSQIVSIQRSTIAVTNVSVTPASANIVAGQTTQLMATITPSNATNPNVTWSSGNPSIATVNTTTGLVTAVAPGTATITATSVSNPTVSGPSSVTVSPPPGPTPLIGLKFDETSGVPQNFGSLTATFTRSSTTPAISTNVSTGGGARSLDFGTTNGNYYAESTSVIDGLKSLTSFTITGWLNIRNTATGSGGNRIVSWINGGGDGVDLVYHGDGKLQIGIDQWPDGSPATSNTGKVTIDAAASAGNWVFFGVTYQSTTNEVKYYFGNNSTDATLDVTRTYNRGAVGTNTAKLAIGHFNDATRAAALDRMLKGLVDEIQIHGSALTLSQIVSIQRSTIAVTNVSVSPTSASIVVGQTSQLTATITPSNATNPSVTWSSNNPSVAAVNSSTGLVTAVAAGSATITATTVDGGFTSPSAITVLPPGSILVTGVNVSPSPLTLNPTQTGQLTAAVIPSNATNQAVTWSTGNASIATVNSTTGLVTAIANGVTTVTATTAQGGYTATAVVQVGGSNDVVIPADLLVTRERKPALPLVERGPFTLASLSVGTIQQVFPAPPCLAGQYYVGFQLYYDLGNTQTQQDWTADLSITLLNNTTPMWTKTLGVKSTDQTFISTAFHDALLSCDPNYRIRVDLKNINGSVPQNNVYLKFLLYKKLEDVFVPSASASLNCTNASEKSVVSWTYSGVAAIAYDLEWVFIADHENFTGTTPQQAFQFKEPVRITTSALNYTHSTYYPNGKLAYRIRAIGYNPAFPEHRIPGNWFYGPCGLITILNHQPDMTWQEQTVFAEEGKHKKVMHYFDGSLRERQVQTSLSTSSDTTVVGETLYDFEGRQAVDVLAVPSASVSLKYKASFNAFASLNATVTSKTSAKRKKFHYDNDVLENSIVSTAGGAGLYYSPANNLNAFRKDYIPDAEGYVFGQTTYLNDGTGRVKVQSGVGKEFKMDGTHTTRTFYGSAAPPELIRLFGTNVGKASHYKKNMVVDPNGQTSVSYLDQEGRTVATALAGESPTNVNPLNTNLPGSQLVIDISTMNQKRDGVSSTISKILNTVPSTMYTFVYNFSSLGSTLQDIGCVSCAYDLKIAITKPDGSLVQLPSIAGNEAADLLSYERKNITIANCVTPTTGTNITFQVNFGDQGDYTITKVLVPTDRTYEQVKTIVSQSATVQTKIQQIQNSYTVDPANCEICTSCPEAEAAVTEAIIEIADKDCENIYQRIVQALKDAQPNNPDYVPTQTEISNHAEYCEYSLCLSSKPSDIFEKEMARASNWTEAFAKGYHNLFTVTTDPYPDPYFRSGAPGAAYTASLQNKLNAIYIGTVGFDSNGDGTQDGTTDYGGAIFQVTDPTNTTFYIDQNGNHTTSTTLGKHILYYDIMSRRAAGQISESNYQAELLKMRWTFFKSFYLEAKRKTRLEIPAVQGCSSLNGKLEAPGLLPTTEEEILEFGNDNGATVPISTEEVEMIYSAITFSCTNTNISPADKATIESRLQSYFNEKPLGLFRFILAQDLGVNPHLVAIQTILNLYGCANLSDFAEVDPLTCVNDTTVTYINKFVTQTGGTTGFFSAPVLTKDQYLMHLDEIADNQRNELLGIGMQLEIGGKSTSTNLLAPLPTLTEYNALIAFYNSTGGNNWTNKTGWSTANPNVVQDVSGWYGVGVDLQGHVVGLSLVNNNLTGTLPSQIGDLTYLNSLQLMNNNLSGSIPTQIGSLTSLTNLNLHGNTLSGSIPTQIGSLSNLTGLQLSQNILSGAIPTAIGNLSQLRTLALFNNVITGAIPSQLGNLSSLQLMDLGSNQLSGSIPATIGNLSNLTFLSLRSNSLSGSIPSSLGNLNQLSTLNLYLNNLSGTIPVELGQLTNLTQLWLYNNQLTGAIPSQLGNLSSLRSLYLFNNSLSGSIPGSLGNLANLEYISLSNNQLTGGIPTSFGALNNVVYLFLQENALSGSIPTELGTMTSLQQLVIGDNQFTGSLPSSLANISNLNVIDVRNNQLSGQIPVQIGSMASLSSFTVQDNFLTFATILPAKQVYPNYFIYSPQALVDVVKTHSVSIGSTLTLTTTIDRTTSPGSLFQWFVKVNGISTALNTPSATGHTVNVPNISAADNGKIYYYQITNTAAPLLTLTSQPQTLNVIGATKTVTICNQYDTNNPTLKLFSYTIDWNQVVQKCMTDAAAENQILITYAIDKLIDEEATTFFNNQRTNCLNSASETLTYSFAPREYHYTLYYYDQAGNLSQTVPPNGVNPLSPAQVTSFLQGTLTDPSHTFITRYQYNSLNQVVYQKTPDAGESRFYYNTKGQLRLSQNAQQLIDNNYAYSKYDNQGRVLEVGEMNTTTALATLTSQLDDALFPLAASYTLSDITKTYYDLPNAGIQSSFAQENLRNRVAWTEVLEKNAPDVIATYYSYDIHGNVESLLQQIPNLGNKRTDYLYELVSGNVNYVLYQSGQPDQFAHRYKYDADNRLKEVATSSDAYLWDIDATYRYYLHGPLARVELGQYRVQGLDYYYTLQGWIKGVNMPYAADPANDGNAGTNLRVGRDVFSYAIGYYENDYKPRNAARIISDTRDQLWTRFKSLYGSTNTGLFNGNISWMVTDLKKIGQLKGARVKGMQAMLYEYDQLNRILESRSLTTYAAATGFATRTATPALAYDEDFSYDANGNILTLKRRDNVAALVDDFTYSYYTGTNKLRYHIPIVRDTIYNGAIATNNKVYRRITVQGTAYAPANQDVVIKAIENIDIDQGFTIQSNAKFRAYVLPNEEGAYNYDAIGNLVWDQNKGVRITWTPSGKVRQVSKGDGTVITFRYDGAGNRIEKKMVKADATTTITRYVRDARGNVMGIYNGVAIIEQAIYGSNRLGIYKGGRGKAQRNLGPKNYELANHLGNVLSVITDNIRMTIDSTWATVVNANDYYAFGSNMQGRNYEDNSYRYAFNGKEKDDKGELGDTHYDYGFRIYNPRLGRFLSVDPLSQEYPWFSPYHFAGNSPILSMDLDGLEPKIVWEKLEFYRDGNKVGTFEDVNIRTKAQLDVAMKKYHDLQIHYAIAKRGNTHEFDAKFAMRRILKEEGVQSMLDMDRATKARVMKQFNELRDGANKILQEYDEEFFNSQYTLAKKNLMVAEAARDEQVAREMAEYNGAITATRWQGVKYTAYGAVALTLAPVEEVTSGGSGTVVAWAQIVWGADNLAGGLARVISPMDYIKNDSQPLKYVLIRSLGKTGGYAYDIVDITLGLKGAMDASKTLEVVGVAETLEDIMSLKDEVTKSNDKENKK